MAVKQLIHPANLYCWLTANATSTSITVSADDAALLETYRQALGLPLHLLIGTWATKKMVEAQGSGAYKWEVFEVSSIDTNTGEITVNGTLTNYADYTTANHAFVSTNLVYDSTMQMWDDEAWTKTGQLVESFEFAKVYTGEHVNGPLAERFAQGEVYQPLSLPSSSDWALRTLAKGKEVSLATATKLIDIADIRAVFVYDTRRDSEPDTWRTDSNLSWQGAYGNFPEVAVLVATGNSLQILNANDGTTWATFNQGSGYALGSDTNNDPQCVFALNGKIWVCMGGSAAEGLFELDFTVDKAYKYNTSARYTWSGTLGNPNTGGSWGSGVSGLALKEDEVAQVDARVVNGKLYIAVVTQGTAADYYGAQVLCIDDREMVSNPLVPWQGTCAKLTRSGTFVTAENYGMRITINATDGNSGITWYYFDQDHGSRVPKAWFSSSSNQLIRSIFIIPASSISNSDSNLILSGWTEGLSLVHEKRNDESNGAAQYITKDWASLPQFGDIRGHWVIPNSTTTVSDGDIVEDVSYREADIVSVNGATVVDGPLGKALEFNGSNQFLKQQEWSQTYVSHDATAGSATLTVSGDQTSYGTNSGDRKYFCYLASDADAWGYLGTATYDSGADQTTFEIWNAKNGGTQDWKTAPSGTVTSTVFRKTEFNSLPQTVSIGFIVSFNSMPLDGGFEHIITKGYYGGTTPNRKTFVVSLFNDLSNGKYGITTAFIFDNLTYTTVTQNELPKTGKFYFVVVVYGSNSVSLYIDGRRIASETASGSVPQDSFLPLTIASDPSSGRLDGIISHPFITAEALTEEQIRRMWLQIKASMRLTEKGYPVGLGGTSNTVRAVAVNGNKVYAGTDDGVTVFDARVPGVRLDYYDSSKTDDSSNPFDITQTKDVSANGGVLAIAGSNGTTTKLWLETDADKEAQWQVLFEDSTNEGLPALTDHTSQSQIFVETALRVPSGSTDQKLRLNADAKTWYSQNALTKNLFPDGSFEMLEEGWTETGSPTVDWAPERPHSGLNALAVKGDSSNYISWDITVQSGSWYTFTCWVDAEDGNTATVELSGATSKTLTASGGTSEDWRQVGYTFKASSGTLTVKFYGTDTAKEAYLDDVILEPVIPVSAYKEQPADVASDLFVEDKYGHASSALQVAAGRKVWKQVTSAEGFLAKGGFSGWFKPIWGESDETFVPVEVASSDGGKITLRKTPSGVELVYFDGTDTTTVTYTGSILHNEWYFIACTWDTEVYKKLRLYVAHKDAAIDDPVEADLTTAMTGSNATVYVGGDALSQYRPGVTVDELRFYDYAPSKGRFQSLKNQAFGGA